MKFIPETATMEDLAKELDRLFRRILKLENDTSATLEREAPQGATVGQVWYDVSTGTLNVFNGASWDVIGGNEVIIKDAESGETVKVTNGGLDVNIQDQHTRALDVDFVQAAGTPTTLSADTVAGAYTMTLTSTTGFVDGVGVGITTGTGGYFFAHQNGAPAGSVITVDTPIDKAYLSDATVLPLTHNMNVDGSVTPSIFQIGPVGDTFEFDVTRILAYLQDGTSMDDGKFGGNGALPNGCVLRRYNDLTSDYTHFFNVKTNGDMALLGYDFTYTDKPPGGTSHGARWRLTYGGPSKHGVTIRLKNSDILEIVIQDDLTVLEAFKMVAQGHVVE